MTPLAYCALALPAAVLLVIVVTIVAPGIAHHVGRGRRRG